jgi:hypothetical protein
MGGGGGSGRVYYLVALAESRGSGGGGSGHAGAGTHNAVLTTGGGSGGTGNVTIRSIPDPYPTTIRLQSSLNPALPGETVTFTATVSTRDPSVPLGGGTVTLYDGISGQMLFNYAAPVTPTPGSPGTGTATFSTSTLPPRSYPVRGVYEGYSESTPESTYTNAKSYTDGFLTQVVGTPQTITFTGPSGVRLGDADVTLGATASSGLPVGYSSATPDVCTIVNRPAWPYSGDQLHILAAGTCTIRADQPGNLSFLPAPQVERTFTIGKTLQTVTFVAPTGVKAGNGDVALVASASSGLPVSYTSATPDICTTPDGTLRPLSSGTCTIRAGQAGDASFEAAPVVERTITITKSSQTIIFYPVYGLTFGGADVSPGAWASSGLPVTYASMTPDVCSVTAVNTVQPVSVGTCLVQAEQAGDASYEAAIPVTQASSVGQLGQTISFTSSPPTNAVVDGTYTPTADATSGLPVTFVASTGCSITDDVVTFDTAQRCTVTALQPGDVNHSAAPPVEQTFVISPLTQTVSFTSTPPTNPIVGGTYTPMAEASSGLPVEITAYGSCGISDGVVTFNRTDDACWVNAAQVGDLRYSAAFAQSQIFSVGPGVQTVQFTSIPPSAPVVGDTYTPTATGTTASGQRVTLGATGSCRLSGSEVFFAAVGTCTVTADQAGNDQYLAAPQQTQVITVVRLPQVVAFADPAPTGKRVGDTYTPTLIPGASDAEPMLGTTSPSTVCTVDTSRNEVSFTGVGTCTLTANQAGDDTYADAPQVERSLTIAKAAQTITFDAPTSLRFGDADVQLSATASSGLPVTYTSTTTDVCTVVADDELHAVAGGTCTIRADQAGGANFEAAPEVERTLTIAETAVVITTPGATRDPRGVSETPFSATLRRADTDAAIEGATVAFVVDGKTICSAVTSSSGIATCKARLGWFDVLKAKSYVATYAGNGGYLAARATGALEIVAPSPKPPKRHTA